MSYRQTIKQPQYMGKLFFFVFTAFYLGALNAATSETEEDSTVSFSESYFSDYQVVTLRDMIRLLPGGVNVLNGLNNNQQSRGLGSNGAQILIDGKRISGKSNDTSTRLSRIQASQVARIDLIRGTAEGLDIRSEGVLINVILKDGEDSSQTYLTELSIIHNTAQQLKPEFLITTNGQSGNIDYGFTYYYDVFTRTWDELEDRMDPLRQIEEVRDLNRFRERVKHSFTSNLTMSLDNGNILRLNGLYDLFDLEDDAFEDQFSFTSGNLLAIEERFIGRDDTKWEVGGDYETELADVGTLKMIFISTREAGNNSIIQNEIINSSSERLFTFDEDKVESERILRVNLSRTILDNQTIELGGEAVFNELAAYQSFDMADYEYSNISEDRYDLFLTHSMSLNQAVSLQSAITHEISTIKQDSIGVQDERDFTFWKPRIELRYDIDNFNQLRFVADRSVSQLNLGNFIARRNTEDDTIDMGNPDLVPQKTLKYSITYEHRLSNDSGSIEVELFRDEISDFISKTRLADGGTGTGNIGDAYRQGLNVEANSKLSMIGLENAFLSLSYQYRDTDMRDPFLDVERRINSNPEHYYLLDFRHDIPELDLVYGLNAHYRSTMYRQDATLYEVRTNYLHIGEIFAEYSLNDNLRLKFLIRNPLKDKKRYDKTFYEDDIANDIIDRVEYRRSDVRPTYKLTLQATF